jgi:prepilin-type N-terminal cleavage/methylation domain-containing protein
MILQTSILKRQNGFTLLEVIIALVIFAIGILGVAAMQLRAIQGNSSGQRLTEASAEAQAMIESIMEEPFASFIVAAPLPLPATPPPWAPHAGQTTNVVGNYTVTRDVWAMPAGSTLLNTEAITVFVTVTWTEAGGQARRVVLSFIKSKNLEDSYI